jgi:hypothetical protein
MQSAAAGLISGHRYDVHGNVGKASKKGKSQKKGVYSADLLPQASPAILMARVRSIVMSCTFYRHVMVRVVSCESCWI